MSVKQQLKQASLEVKSAPKWLKYIYEQNDAMEKQVEQQRKKRDKK